MSREKNETGGKFWLVLISGLVRQHQNMFWGFVKSICTERILPFCPQHMVFVAWLIKTLYAMNSPIKLPQLIFKNMMFVVVYIWVHWKYTRPYFPHFSQQPQNKGSTGQKKKKDPTGKFHEISKFNRLEHSKAYHSKGSDGRTEDLKQIFFTSATILLPKIGPFFYIFLNLICVKFWICYWEEFFFFFLPLDLETVSPPTWRGFSSQLGR